MLLVVVCMTSLMAMGASAATVATPVKCCFEKEFTATLGEVGAKVTSGDSSSFTGSIKLSYDFFRKRVVTVNQLYVNGQASTITFLGDFVNRIQYQRPALGQCTMRKMTDKDQMLPPCIPDDAIFRGHTVFGYGSETLPANLWDFTVMNSTVNVKLAMTDECVPVFEAFLSNVNGVATETTVFYTGYHPGIDDMSAFDPPTDCVLIQDDNNNNNDNNNNGNSGGNRPIGR